MLQEHLAYKRKFVLLAIIYFGFVSLGLPDNVLGVIWPEMRETFALPIEKAGIMVAVVSVFSVITSFASGWILRRTGTGAVLAICGFLTGAALLGHGLAVSWPMLLAMTIPLGFGQGAVDAALNGYVSKHYTSRHMNWLHCCWGIGATFGPFLMASLLDNEISWRTGYLTLAGIQLALATLFLWSLKLWERPSHTPEEKPDTPTSFGAKARLLTRRSLAGCAFFFFYTGLEVCIGLWGASFLIEEHDMHPASAGFLISLYWCALTLGRFLIGLFSDRIGNTRILRGALALAFSGCLLLAFARDGKLFFFCFALIGLSLAPLYPGMMHETPVRYGPQNTQTLIGFQVGIAFLGVAVVPFLAGQLAGFFSLAILPYALLFLCTLLAITHEISLGTLFKKRQYPAP